MGKVPVLIALLVPLLLGSQYNIPFNPPAAGGGGSPSLTQSNVARGTGTTLDTTLSGVASGSNLILACSYEATFGMNTVSDDCSGTWTERQDGGTSTRNLSIWSSSGSNGSCTVTADPDDAAPTSIRCVLMEWADLNYTTFLTNSGGNFGTTATSGTVAASGSDTVYIGSSTYSGGSTTLVPEGTWTEVHTTADPASTALSVSYIIQTGTTDESSFTLGAGRSWFAAVASFAP